jgi:hypothetical protein
MKYGTTTILDRKVISNPKVRNLWGGISTNLVLAYDLIYNDEDIAVGLRKQYVPATACYVKPGVQDKQQITLKDLRSFTKRAWDLTNGDLNYFTKLAERTSKCQLI